MYCTTVFCKKKEGLGFIGFALKLLILYYAAASDKIFVKYDTGVNGHHD